jgi:hypothetical protein
MLKTFVLLSVLGAAPSCAGAQQIASAARMGPEQTAGSEAPALIEGRATYVSSTGIYGRLENSFEPGFRYGAPARSADFGGVEYFKPR